MYKEVRSCRAMEGNLNSSLRSASVRKHVILSRLLLFYARYRQTYLFDWSLQGLVYVCISSTGIGMGRGHLPLPKTPLDSWKTIQIGKKEERTIPNSGLHREA
jgi:hypothetical protein